MGIILRARERVIKLVRNNETYPSPFETLLRNNTPG